MSVQLWSLSNRSRRGSCRIIDRGRGHNQETALTADWELACINEGKQYYGTCNNLIIHVTYDACQIYTKNSPVVLSLLCAFLTLPIVL